MSDIPASASKPILRASALAKRDALSSAQRAAAAEVIARRGLPFDMAHGAIVAGYSPIRSEIDPIPLMRVLAAQGAQLALPVIVARDAPLIFRAWSADDRLRRGPLGILEPSPDAVEVVPDILLVPLAAFDRSGHRIGYGAGHYDRSFARLRPLKAIMAVGVAFGLQEINAVPMQPHDVALDYVLTETQSFDCRSS